MTPLRHIGEAALPALPSEGGPSLMRKRCSTCRDLRAEHEFRPDPRASDGLRSQCIHCESSGDRARYLRRIAADPQAMTERNSMAGRRYRARLAAGA